MLETLADVKELGGFELSKELALEDWAKDWDEYLHVDLVLNTIAFKLQRGPIKEVGVNGCQVVTILEAAYEIIKGLNKKYPCPQNEDTLHFLGAAIKCQHARTANREARGVEGTSNG